MRKVHHVHRVTVGRTRELRGPDAFERLAVAFIGFVVLGFALWYGLAHIRMTKSSEAISLALIPEYNLILYRAHYGEWPAPENPHIVPAHATGKYVKSVSLEPGGGLRVEMGFGPHRSYTNSKGQLVFRPPKTSGYLSFRPQLVGAPGARAVIFLCGHADPVGESPHLRASDTTTLPVNFLPPACR